MESDQEPESLPSTQLGMTEVERGEASMQRHPNGPNGARPKHGKLVCREYGLLVPEELAGNPAFAGLQGRGDGP